MTGDVELAAARHELAELRTAVALLRAERQAAAELATSLDQLTEAVEAAPKRIDVGELPMAAFHALAATWRVLERWDVARYHPTEVDGRP